MVLQLISSIGDSADDWTNPLDRMVLAAPTFLIFTSGTVISDEAPRSYLFLAGEQQEAPHLRTSQLNQVKLEARSVCATHNSVTS